MHRALASRHRAEAGSAVPRCGRARGGDDDTVTIAGEAHIPASGAAEVSCAQQHGPIIDDLWRGRIHPDEHKPVVDSGLKTISATVADGSGAAAEATAEVYAILAVS